MKKPSLKKPIQPYQQPATPTPPAPKQVDPAQKKVEELPAVEWGDRINSGKSIARGGKADGFVPGAMPSK